MNWSNRLCYMVAALLALAACSPLSTPSTQPPQTAAPAADDLAGTQWRLESLGTPGAEAPVMPGFTLTVSFDGQGRANGQGGCNSFGGQYQIKDHSLAFSQIAQTLRACADSGASEQEQRYMSALQAAGQYELAGGRLIIHYDNGSGVLNFVKVPAA